MNIKSLVSVTALTAAMAFSVPAFAQTMIGDMSVSEDDMAQVSAYCEELYAASTTEAGGDDEEAQSEGANVSESEPAPSGTSQAVTTIDLSTITLEQCNEAGITDGTVDAEVVAQ
tara:strand:+ start:269 stop:613 length:345 start_codon:yes stop_codon:yes gene_type:complete